MSDAIDMSDTLLPEERPNHPGEIVRIALGSSVHKRHSFVGCLGYWIIIVGFIEACIAPIYGIYYGIVKIIGMRFCTLNTVPRLTCDFQTRTAPPQFPPTAFSSNALCVT